MTIMIFFPCSYIACLYTKMAKIFGHTVLWKTLFCYFLKLWIRIRPFRKTGPRTKIFPTKNRTRNSGQQHCSCTCVCKKSCTVKNIVTTVNIKSEHRENKRCLNNVQFVVYRSYKVDTTSDSVSIK